jgi:integrase/recombinase XerD
MAKKKRKRTPAANTADRRAAKPARPGGGRGKASKKKTKRVPRSAKTDLVPLVGKDSALIPRNKRNSLLAWFGLYLGVEAGPPDGNTFKAKKRDLQEFIDYLRKAAGTDHPVQWTKSLTEGFLKYLQNKRGLAATTVNRMLATLKHTASWLHSQRPFLAGNPCKRIRAITIEDPEWVGLEEIQINRLKSAAEQLVHLNTRADQQPVRDHAILLILLHTALRVSELTSLDLKQYKGKYLTNIKRKGKKVTRELLLAKPARKALDQYIKDVRGRKHGPLVQSRTGTRLAAQNVDDALKKIAAQANATLRKKEQIHLSAHMLRHTALRRAAEKEDIRFAMKLSGHTSPKYIWRYTEPSRQQQEQALEDLF